MRFNIAVGRNLKTRIKYYMYVHLIYYIPEIGIIVLSQIDWDGGDPRNPANFSHARKWIITIAASALTGLSGMSLG